MTIQLYGGSVLLSGGTVALHSDCCCSDPECLCTIDISETPGKCQCLDVAFGADSTKPALGIRLQGTPTWTGFGSFTCATFDHLFMANCGEPFTTWWYHQANGTTFIGGVLHYRYISYRVRVSYASDAGQGAVDFTALEIYLRCMQIAVTSPQTTDTWVTDPISTNFENSTDSWKRTTFIADFDSGLNRDWRYQLVAPCTESCNSYYQWPDCASTITFTESNPSVGVSNFWSNAGSFTCNVTGLTFTPYSASNP